MSDGKKKKEKAGKLETNIQYFKVQSYVYTQRAKKV